MSYDAGAIEFAIKAAGKQVFKAEMDEVAGSAKNVEGAAQGAAAGVNSLGESTEKTGQKAKTATSGVNENARATKDAGETAKTAKAAQEGYGKATDAAGASSVATAPKVRTVREEIAGLSEESKRAARDVGVGMAAVGGAVVAAAGLAIKAAVDWESAWAGVTKTVDTDPAGLVKLENDLRKLSLTMPASQVEIAGVAEAAGQLGVKAKDVASFTKVMIDLGETTNLSADEAATSLAQFMNIMQTAPDDVDNLGSSLVALGNNGASTERDIVQMAQRIAGAGKIVGLTEGEVLGLANALASAGIEVEAGGSAISSVMIDMSKSVATGDAKLAGFAKTAGMSAEEFSTAFREDPASAIASFVEGLGKISAAGGNVFGLLDDLGQSDIRVSRALLSMANSGDLFRSSLELGNTAMEENNALQTEAEKRYATSAAQMQILANTTNDLAITAGSTFLPILNQVVAGVQDFTEGLAGAPPEAIQLGTSLVVAAGGVTLVAGVALLAVPRILELRTQVAALRAEMASMPGTSAKMAAGLKAVMAVGIGLWLANTAKDLINMSQEATGTEESVDSLGKKIDELSAKGAAASAVNQKLFGVDLGNSRLSQYTDGGWWSDFGKSVDGLKKSTQWLTDLNPFANIMGLNNTFAGDMEKLDKALAEQVSNGNGEKAVAVYEALKEQTNGSADAIKKLNDYLPEFNDSMGGSAEAGTNAAAAQLQAASATEALNTATQASSAALLERQGVIAESDASFISLTEAYSSAQDKAREWAEGQAAATDDVADTWENFYDGISVSFDDYLAELQKQVDAQSAWESNMVLLAGRVSEGTLAELERLGPEAAPLVASMVTASGDELAKMEALFGEKSDAATNNFGIHLTEAQTVIKAAAGQLGQGAADEIAQKLASGTSTVEQIMAEYGLKIEGIKPQVQIGTEQAQANLDAFIAANDGRTIFLGSRVATGPGGTGGITFADGGFYGAPKVSFHSNGSLTENRVAQFSHGGEYRVWGEDETGGEVYIPLAESKRAQSEVYLKQTAGLFGFDLVRRGEGSDGVSSSTSSAAQPSLVGLRLEGSLDLGDGLTAKISAVATEVITKQGKTLSAGLRDDS